ncbi:hypothetical protein PXO_00530 [Xanthomonas oryzae pv. oryzae PXO99A]|uniref:Transposase n=1 Tax=Xanthomonas oryzae pv. oryzae (strain PXO99A) TaxID=360094 RepID=A0A0K0GK60_XANOP|nr:hypothetical protein PXO_00530 [Xanthomonas oryzae pv. oryzae PXO99A]
MHKSPAACGRMTLIKFALRQVDCRIAAHAATQIGTAFNLRRR